MSNLRSILLLPPAIWNFLLISVTLLMYFLLPKFNLISYPYNLVGFIFILIEIAGIKYITALFSKKKTPTSAVKWEKPRTLLKERGFQYTRNPIYWMHITGVIGSGILSTNIFGLLFIPLIQFIILDKLIIPHEEEMCLKSFGDEYIRYKKEVNRWY